jgi:hypothetical protein
MCALQELKSHRRKEQPKKSKETEPAANGLTFYPAVYEEEDEQRSS